MTKKTNKTREEIPIEETQPKKTKNKKIDISVAREGKGKIVLGLFLLFLAIYLAFAIFSYLLFWSSDFDKIYTFEWKDLSGGTPIENWGGYLGAWISHFLVYKMVGVGSILFALHFFLIGSLLTIKKQLLPLSKTFKISFLFIVWSAVFFGSVFRNSSWAILGGTLGYQSSLWIQGITGIAGLVFILLFTLIAFLTIHFPYPIIWFRLWMIRRMEQAKIARERRQQQKMEEARKLQNEKTDKYNTQEFAVDENDDDEITIIKQKDGIPRTFATIKEQETKNEIPTDSEPVDNNEILEIEAIAEDEGDLDLEVEIANSNEDEVVNPIINEKSAVINPVVQVKEEELADELEVEAGEDEAGEVMVRHGIDTPYDPTEDLADYVFPKLEFLEMHGSDKINIYKEELEANKNKIVETLNHYNIKIQKIKATVGPTVTLYEIVPAPGIRISKIRNLEDDIALSLSALGIRIIAPIPGKGSIGIEVPNSKPEIVPMRAVLQSKVFQESTFDLPVVIGKTINNESFAFDLAKMPHLLMAGATGQGKSVGLNAIITSLLYKKHPAQLKFVMVDPKKVELTLFSKIERHYLAKLPNSEEAIITDTQAVVHTLYSLVTEMDNRYDLLKDAQVRNIKEYNAKFISRRLNPNNGHRYMPYIVLVVDEFADLIMTAGKEVEGPIARLAQLARAIGIHLIIATQRPSVNVITGIIKANFPARVAFRVTSRIDSRTILDAGGADQLIGRGDMLFSTGNDMVRLQCAFIDTPEVEQITDFIGSQRGYTSAFILPESKEDMGEQDSDISPADRDELFEDAARVIVNAQQGSTSLIQRKLKLGYNRAGRIIDQLEAAGIVGPFEGSKAREVRVGNEMALEQFLKDLKAKEQN